MQAFLVKNSAAIDDDFISGIRRRSFFYKLSRIYVEYAVEEFPTFIGDTIKGTLSCSFLCFSVHKLNHQIPEKQPMARRQAIENCIRFHVVCSNRVNSVLFAVRFHHYKRMVFWTLEMSSDRFDEKYPLGFKNSL